MSGQFALVLHPAFNIPPKRIKADNPFDSTFGLHESDVTAAGIVRFCQAQGGWITFSRNDIRSQVPDLDRQDQDGLGNLVLGGFLTKDAAGNYSVTPEFILRVFPKFEI